MEEGTGTCEEVVAFTEATKKPPIGVMPRQLWQETRVQDLTRAIHEYIKEGRFQPAEKWVMELAELLPEVVRNRGGL